MVLGWLCQKGSARQREDENDEAVSEFNREWVRAVVGNVRDALNAKISWLWDEVVKVQTANAALKTDIVNLRSVNAALQVELESLRDRVDALEAPSPPPEPTPDPNIPM